MIYVGIDDTDTRETRGTNQLARALASRLRDRLVCRRITRHQLLDDPRVRYTSKNGSASLTFEPRGEVDLVHLAGELAEAMRADFIPGSDPGLCVAAAASVTDAVRQFGRRCQRELVTQQEARRLAADEGIWLAGLGGTEDGVIGALAAVGLAAGDHDGRVVQWGDWAEELSGTQELCVLAEYGVSVRELETGRVVERGRVDVGKKLRPNWRGGRCVLFVRPAQIAGDDDERHPRYESVKLP